MDGLKEKYNIFKGVVGLLENKLSSTIIAILIILNIAQFIKNGALNDKIADDKDKMYKMVIEEVRRQVKPIEAKQDSSTVVIQNTSDSVKTLIGGVKSTLKNINKKLK